MLAWCSWRLPITWTPHCLFPESQKPACTQYIHYYTRNAWHFFSRQIKKSEGKKLLYFSLSRIFKFFLFSLQLVYFLCLKIIGAHNRNAFGYSLHDMLKCSWSLSLCLTPSPKLFFVSILKRYSITNVTRFWKS